MPVPRDAVLRARPAYASGPRLVPLPVIVPARAAHPEAELREDAIDRLCRENAALLTLITELGATITQLRSTIEAMQIHAGERAVGVPQAPAGTVRLRPARSNPQRMD